MQSIYTTQVIVEGGRAGTARSMDGNLNLTLTMPKEFGGEGKPGTNPEQLFAAGYAACFESTLRFVAAQKKLPVTRSAIQAIVHVSSDPNGGYLLSVELEIELAGLDRKQAEALVEDAKKICPYHKMSHGNIDQRYRVKS